MKAAARRAAERRTRTRRQRADYPVARTPVTGEPPSAYCPTCQGMRPMVSVQRKTEVNVVVTTGNCRKCKSEIFRVGGARGTEG